MNRFACIVFLSMLTACTPSAPEKEPVALPTSPPEVTSGAVEEVASEAVAEPAVVEVAAAPAPEETGTLEVSFSLRCGMTDAPVGILVLSKDDIPSDVMRFETAASLMQDVGVHDLSDDRGPEFNVTFRDEPVELGQAIVEVTEVLERDDQGRAIKVKGRLDIAIAPKAAPSWGQAPAEVEKPWAVSGPFETLVGQLGPQPCG